MSGKCELLEKCGFFLNFSGNSEVIKNGWVKAFCENDEKSKNCKRKQVRLATGKPPADNMTPTGRVIGG